MRCIAKKHFEVAAEANIALLVQVKDNQPGLHQRIQDLANTAAPLGSACSRDHGRNRDESRTVRVFDPADKLADTDWHNHIAAVIRVEREVFTRDVKTGLLRHASEIAFYVSNTPITAARAATAIRAHWAIETTSNYSRDVTWAKIARASGPTPAYSPGCAVSLSTSSRPTEPVPSARTATAPLSQASTVFSNLSADSVEQPWAAPTLVSEGHLLSNVALNYTIP